MVHINTFSEIFVFRVRAELLDIKTSLTKLINFNKLRDYKNTLYKLITITGVTSY